MFTDIQIYRMCPLEERKSLYYIRYMISFTGIKLKLAWELMYVFTRNFINITKIICNAYGGNSWTDSHIFGTKVQYTVLKIKYQLILLIYYILADIYSIKSAESSKTIILDICGLEKYRTHFIIYTFLAPDTLIIRKRCALYFINIIYY